jgi:hypothetical protein
MLDLGSTVGSVVIPYIYAMLAAVCSLYRIFSMDLCPRFPTPSDPYYSSLMWLYLNTF